MCEVKAILEIEVKCFPTNYQKCKDTIFRPHGSSRLLLKDLWFQNFLKDFEKFKLYNEYFLISYLLFTKKGNGKYQAMIFQELHKEKPDAGMN